MPRTSEKRASFTIGIDPNSVIEDAARAYVSKHGTGGIDKLVTKDGKVTDEGWFQLNFEISVIEKNALKWLAREFEGTREQRRNRDGDIPGTIWYDPTDARQKELVELGRTKHIDMSDLDTAFNGVSSFGRSVLGGAIVLVDVDQDDEED